MKFIVELYMDPVAIVLNNIDLNDEVMIQLQQDLESEFLGNLDISDISGLSDIDLDDIYVDDFMPFISVNSRTLAFKYAEEDALVYSVECDLDVEGMRSSLT